MTNNKFTFSSPSPLKPVNSPSPDFCNFYNDIQSDFKENLSFLITISEIGYKKWNNDDTFVEVKPEESTELLKQLAGINEGELRTIVKIIGKGGNPATNLYGLFYENYKPLTKLTTKSEIYCHCHQYSALVNKSDIPLKNNLPDSKEDRLKLKEKSAKFLKSELPSFPKILEVLEKASFSTAWKYCSKKIGNPKESTKAVSIIKNLNIFPKIKRPKDKPYCTALMSMVSSAFSGWNENNNNHQEETENLIKKFNSLKIKFPEIYKQMEDLSQSLDKKQYGLHKDVLYNSISFIKGKSKICRHLTAVEELKTGKYPLILNASKEELGVNYKAIKLGKKIENRSKYISLPRFKKDFAVPFGLTGKGCTFNLSVYTTKQNRQAINININLKDGKESIPCYASKYFCNPKIESAKFEFILDFDHISNDRKFKVSVKELNLQKKDGQFYFYVPYSITHAKTNFFAELFFRKVEPKKELIEKLANSIKVNAVDLNMSIPITAVSATVNKTDRKNIIEGENAIIPDYGFGKVEEPFVVCGNSEKIKEMSNLISDGRSITNIIRQHKANRKIGAFLINEDILWLQKYTNLVSNKPSYSFQRRMIDVSVKKWHKAYGVEEFECRASGYTDLSECIKLIQLKDVKYSLDSSYCNIHVVDQKQYVKKYKIDNSRVNFRRYVSNKFGAEIAKLPGDLGFFEALEMQFDRDDNNNSLIKLFAPGQLMKSIENAMHKAGKGCVFVPPAGTSQTDPVSGDQGYRPSSKEKDPLPAVKANKENLYVFRNGVFGRLNSDLAAPINILNLGLNRSVFTRKLFVGQNGKLKKDEEVLGQTNKSTGKRLEKFIEVFGINKQFSEGLHGSISSCEKGDYRGWMYFSRNENGFDLLSQKQIEERQQLIKQFVLDNDNIPEFSLIPDSGKVYNAFRTKRYLIDIKP